MGEGLDVASLPFANRLHDLYLLHIKIHHVVALSTVCDSSLLCDLPATTSTTFSPMSKSQVYRSVWLVVQALLAEHKDEWGIPLPEDPPGTEGYAASIRRLQDLEMGHAVGGRHGRTWRGQIGSIDGCIVSRAVRTRGPSCFDGAWVPAVHLFVRASIVSLFGGLAR